MKILNSAIFILRLFSLLWTIGHHSKTKVKFLKKVLLMMCCSLYIYIYIYIYLCICKILEERNRHSEMKKSTCSGQTGKFGQKIALLKAHSKV